MKNIAVVVLALAVVLLSTPMFGTVMAKAPTVTSFKAVQAGRNTSFEKDWYSNGILHRKVVVNEVTIIFYLPADASTPPYTFSFYNVLVRTLWR